MTEETLASVFRAALASGAPTVETPAERELQEYVSAAQKARPGLAITDAELVHYVAARAIDGRLPPIAYAGDALLACACAQGIQDALDLFQREYGPVIERVLWHRQASVALADDARQIVQERVLVGDPERGNAPKIASYRGGGPLKSWIASIAATTLLMLRRESQRRREDPVESVGPAVAGIALEPELDYLKARYKPEVEEAIIHAIDQLGDRERTLLHLNIGERLSIDALGTMYSVNRATAARWLAAARAALLRAVRERLRARLRLSDTECDSLVALVDSRLEVSIARRLAGG